MMTTRTMIRYLMVLKYGISHGGMMVMADAAGVNGLHAMEAAPGKAGLLMLPIPPCTTSKQFLCAFYL